MNEVVKEAVNVSLQLRFFQGETCPNMILPNSLPGSAYIPKIPNINLIINYNIIKF